jgi:chromate transport protein ChrA
MGSVPQCAMAPDRKRESTMTGPSTPVALTAHLALLSSISFGGFQTVLPDIRHFVVATHGWMTDQEFTSLFAMAQAVPGPNMILMMSFVGWKVWGFPGAVASAFATDREVPNESRDARAEC